MRTVTEKSSSMSLSKQQPRATCEHAKSNTQFTSRSLNEEKLLQFMELTLKFKRYSCILIMTCITQSSNFNIKTFLFPSMFSPQMSRPPFNNLGIKTLIFYFSNDYFHLCCKLMLHAANIFRNFLVKSKSSRHS